MRPREYHDPVTGDVLTLSEFVSWRLQSMIRNWWFIGTITVITVLMFIKWKVWGHDPLDQWNYAASWLALWIESCVGIAMFSQTRRDAKIIREIKAIAQNQAEVMRQQAEIQKQHTAILGHVEQMATHLEASLPSRT